MALENKKLTITADTLVNGSKVVTFGAVMDLHTGNMRIYEQRGNDDLMRENRDIVREDRAEFEDFAWAVQADVKGILGLTNEPVEEEGPETEDA